jgi:Zn-finger nucleic acid-binding protein
MPGSLNCPNCGAAVESPDATRCGYCTSALTTVSCPACLAPMFAGMQFCPHCGARGDRTALDRSALPCPGCKGQMLPTRVGSTELFECPACGSTWVDAEVFTKLCLDREQRGVIAAMVGSESNKRAAPPTGKVRYLRCARCNAVMNRENFGKRSGVIIDVCKGHGVWFESRELQAVMAFIDRGGLERARTLEIQRLKAERDLERARTGGVVPPPDREEDQPSGFIAEALRTLLD